MTGRDKLDCVPLFFGELADDIFVCGKTINLLKLCCPEVKDHRTNFSREGSDFNFRWGKGRVQFR